MLARLLTAGLNPALLQAVVRHEAVLQRGVLHPLPHSSRFRASLNGFDGFPPLSAGPERDGGCFLWLQMPVRHLLSVIPSGPCHQRLAQIASSSTSWSWNCRPCPRRLGIYSTAFLNRSLMRFVTFICAQLCELCGNLQVTVWSPPSHTATKLALILTSK